MIFGCLYITVLTYFYCNLKSNFVKTFYIEEFLRSCTCNFLHPDMKDMMMIYNQNKRKNKNDKEAIEVEHDSCTP